MKAMNIDPILRSIVAVRSSIPEDAFTATTLGTRREGSGVVIRESGLVLTIGYLITEAEEVWLTSNEGQVVPAHALAYDQETGFGLVQALDRLDLPTLDFGDAAETSVGDAVVLADGIGRFVQANIVAKQEFAGYWEYLLEEAIFIAPAHPSWGGAALVGADGKLLGIGSLRLQVSRNGEVADINMVVPIDLLPPVLDDLLTRGRLNKPPRPWLGAFSAESNGKVVVMSVAEGGPAAQAGMRQGDIISDVRDGEVEGLADFYRKVWASGPAGAEVPMRVVRDGRETWLRVKSADRSSFLRKPQLQ
jgi:S1-C subfamily serine protease